MLRLFGELKTYDVTMEIRPDKFIDGFIFTFTKDTHRFSHCVAVDSFYNCEVDVEDQLLAALGLFLRSYML